LLEVIRQDYILAARARGLSERAVIWRHAVRNSIIPVITIVGTLLPALIGGSIIVEQIFTIPGMGQLAWESLVYRDYPVIMANLFIVAVLTLLGMLLSDVLYKAVDPRVSFD
jgi:peptide/nickel transport system permease protein